jgi:hypothetical protein
VPRSDAERNFKALVDDCRTSKTPKLEREVFVQASVLPMPSSIEEPLRPTF